MALTETAIRAAKPKAAQYKLTDGTGMYLLVHPNGSKYWRLDTRLTGRRKTFALGVYPQLTLLAARKARDAAREQIGKGEDPTRQRKLAKMAGADAASNTFKRVAEEWVAKLTREGRAPSTITKITWLLDFAYPMIGDLPFDKITAADVRAVLLKVENRGRYDSARRLRSTCGAVFRYAMATGRAQSDPTPALRGALTAPNVKHRAAITDAKGAGGLLRAIEGYEGQPVTHAALRLAPHVFLRPGELRTAEWVEIDFEHSVWTVPAKKTKMRKEHKMPLSRQAVAILAALQKLTGDGRLIFPGIRTLAKPLSENTLNAALRRIGYDKTEMTAHGFRAMASTLLNESGKWNPDAIERALAHGQPDSIRAAYHRGAYWEERVRMAQWWSDHLDALRDGARVIELRRALYKTD